MNERIRALAQKLVSEYGTDDPEELCERQGACVLDYPLPDSVRGFFVRVKGILAVVVNDRLCREERRQVLAHELGHMVLHPELNLMFMRENTYCVPGRFEREADLFEGCLLLPEERLRELSEDGYSIQQIASISGLSLEVVRMLAEC